MKCAPIILFVYNRLWHTQQTIEALQKNFLAGESDLFVYSDGYKNLDDEQKIKELRSYLKTISGFKSVSVIEREQNMGLAGNVIDGITTVVNKYGRIIVLEDDLITSPYFLKYINEGLEMYQSNQNVYSINGYMFDIRTERTEAILSPLAASSWGWATWKEKWTIFQEKPQFINEIQTNRNLTKWFNFADYDYATMLNNQNSWAIRWYYSIRIRNGLGLFPTKSLVYNIGFDGSGVHFTENVEVRQIIYQNDLKIEKKDEIDIDFYYKMLLYFTKPIEIQNTGHPYIIRQMKRIFKKLF